MYLIEGHPLSLELSRKWGHAFDEIKNYEFKAEYKIALTSEWTPTVWDQSWLRMVIDLKVKKQPGYTVYDWKTGKEYPEHYDQKQLYASGVLAEHPEENSIRAVHVYLDQGRQTVRDYHRDQLIAARIQWSSKAAKLETYLSNPDMGQWIPEPNHFCKWCNYSKANKGPCKF
jgi:hypothetical protein